MTTNLISSQTKQAIKNNLVHFRDVVLVNDESRELEPADFHFTFSEYLLDKNNNVALECYRESAKSAYALRAFPLHCLAFPNTNRSYIVILKNTQRVASAKLKDIINEYQSNPLLKHNLVKIKEESAQVFSVDVKDEQGKIINVRIEAYGKGASIRGLNSLDRRPNIIVCDDLQDKEDVSSETVCESDWDWFLSDVIFLGKLSRVFLIGNNLGERCIIERCINGADELGFEWLRIPVIVDGVPTWQAQNTVESIQKEKDNFANIGKIDIWLMEKMCCAIAEENKIFQESDFRYYSPNFTADLVNKCNLYACLDPASSTNKDACFRAIVLTGVDADNSWFVLDCDYGRWDSAETIDKIFACVVKYRLKDFYIEAGWYEQVIQPFLMQEMKKRNIFFNVVPVKHTNRTSKLDRIKALQPRFKAHTVHFPDSAWWLAEFKSELAGVTNSEIKSQYIDIVDAFSFTNTVAIPPIRSQQSFKQSLRQNTSQSLFDIAGF